MQRSFPLRRRVTPATVILALAVGCSREEDLHERFDFIADYPNAECWFEQETIETGRYRDRSRLTDGWSFPEHDRDENAPPDSWVWANELEAKPRRPIASSPRASSCSQTADFMERVFP